uniref:Non-lysosomal glucosylceramidase n=1 Tax=Globodera rostochiensis TaxID=31243 RepID=A0A914GQY9_GLORO
MENCIREVEFDFDALGGRFGWFARADNEAQERRTPFDRPTLSQILQLVPFVWRYTLFWIRNVFDRERIFIDIFRPFHHYPYNALPCGAIGSGSIGRDFRGAFCKFNLRPGLVQQHSEPIKADQFILTLMSAEGVLVRQTVLSAVTSFAASDDLSSWDFSLSPKDVTYRALYPRAWTKFELPEEKVVVLMRQISPVLPRDYKNASLPCTLFTFRVLNNSERALNVSITFTFRNENKLMKGTTKECSSDLFRTKKAEGVLLHQSVSGMPCTFALGALCRPNVQMSSGTRSFDPSGDGFALWNLMATERKLIEIVEEPKNNRSLGVALALHAKVAAGSATDNEEEMAFALVWHMFGLLFTLAAENALFKNGILNFLMLPSRAKWEAEIEKWQRPIMEDQALPDWFKSALFNELYFLTDGGSVWFCYDPQWRQQEPQLSEYSARQFSRFGRFAYLESWEYRMFNTYDVHFYASFALGQLFPQLEHSIQAEFNDQVEHFNPKSVKYHMSGICSPVKARNRVPHDLGNPAEEPWLKTNAYRMHDTSEWKDLNLKFVLCAYRTFCSVLGRDRQFLSQVWPQVQIVVNEGLEHWDTDCDGMIENFGTADQTYDAWKMRGVSAYCGSLWLAALRVAVAMAEEMELPKLAEDYRAILERAKEVFMSKLWNGRYFNFDECSDEIMADQLCGYWFLHSIDPKMADQILPTAYVDSTLDTIFEFNVDKFSGGTLGAVNGMCRNGKVASSLQADEVWVGTNYALASLFIQRGHFSRGFKIARGPFVACYHRLGLQFQTPEALYQHRFYRAIGYMRPLSIWAIYCALRTAKLGQREMDNPNGRLTN